MGYEDSGLIRQRTTKETVFEDVFTDMGVDCAEGVVEEDDGGCRVRCTSKGDTGLERERVLVIVAHK